MKHVPDVRQTRLSMERQRGDRTCIVNAHPQGDIIAVVRPAGFGRRAGAAMIDWMICIVGPFMALGVLTSALVPFVPDHVLLLWIPALAVIVVGYVTVFTHRGATLGMLATDVRIVRGATGRVPGLGRSLSRGVLALSGVASGLIVLMVGFSDPPATGYSRTDQTILAVAMFLLAAHVLGRLWMLADTEHRTLVDRLLGVAVIRADTNARP
jgi:uncharacterized RDD family membrane protein YckC